MVELSDNFFHDNFNGNSEEDHELEGGEIDLESVRWHYRNETWSQFHFTYDPLRKPCHGSRGR